MPARERSLRIDGRDLGGDQSYNQRRHREAMARNTSPQGVAVRVLTSNPCSWTMPIGITTMTRRRAIARAGCCRDRIRAFTGSAISLAALQPMARGRTLGEAPGHRRRGSDGDLRRMFRRAVVAARRRSDQSRNGDAVAGRGDRGKYRSRQYRRGRRHPDRARRPNPHRRAYPRHHRPGSRPRHRGERAEGRGEAIRHGAADGTAARREPQSGGCRARGAHHAGWLCHGFHRRQCAAAGNRRHLEERRRRAAADRSASTPPPVAAFAVTRRPRSGTPRRLPDSARADCWPASTGSTA